jgi:DNA-binding beta-propeller fold protein YncE
VRRRRLLAGAAAAATLLGAVAAAPSRPPVTSGRLAVAASIDVGGSPSSLVATAGAVWVATGNGGVVRIDPATDSVAVRLRPGGAVIALAAGFGDLWAIDAVGDRLLRIDPGENRVLARLPVGRLPTGLAVGHGRVWVLSQIESTVVGIDPRTSRVTASRRFAYGELWPGGLAVAGDGVWVITGRGSEVTRLDPRTAAIARRVGVEGARTLAAVGRSVWIGRAGGRSLVRIAANGPVVVGFTGAGSSDGRGPALTAGRSVWVADRNRLAAFSADGEPELNARLRTSGRVGAIAVAGDMWVAD